MRELNGFKWGYAHNRRTMRVEEKGKPKPRVDVPFPARFRSRAPVVAAAAASVPSPAPEKPLPAQWIEFFKSVTSEEANTVLQQVDVLVRELRSIADNKTAPPPPPPPPVLLPGLQSFSAGLYHAF